MDIARKLMNNSIRSFKAFIADSKEIELKDILKELNSNELEKILNASKKAYDENLSKKY